MFKAASRIVTAILVLFFLPPQLHAATVRINEIMASNGATIMDEDGEYKDWIELFNAGAESVNLSGWGLSDSYINLFKWTFPAETFLSPGAFLLVWASGKNRTGQHLHTNFSIDASGEEILLTSPSGEVVDELTPIEIPRDISYGRTLADPEVWTYFAHPTPNKENAGPDGHFLLAEVSFSEVSRTFTSKLLVALNGAEDGQVIRYTIDGSERSNPDRDAA